MDRVHDTVSHGGFVSERPFPAQHGETLRLWGARPGHDGAPAHPPEGGLTRYFMLARVSDNYFDLLGEAQGQPGARPASALAVSPRLDVPVPVGDDAETARGRSQASQRLRRLLGKPVTEERALHRWQEARRFDLSGIVKNKLNQTRVLHNINNQMGGRYKSTTKALQDFDKASHAAARRPAYFQHSMRNLVTECESYGELVGRQIKVVRRMHDQNSMIATAGGHRPVEELGGERRDVVSGPLSADVEQPDAERNVGAFELRSTRVQLGQAIDTMRASIDSMRRGLQVAREIADGRGEHDLGTPRGTRQKDVVGEHDVPSKGGASAPHFHLDGEEVAIARLTSQLQTLQQGYDELWA